MSVGTGIGPIYPCPNTVKDLSNPETGWAFVRANTAPLQINCEASVTPHLLVYPGNLYILLDFQK